MTRRRLLTRRRNRHIVAHLRTFYRLVMREPARAPTTLLTTPHVFSFAVVAGHSLVFSC